VQEIKQEPKANQSGFVAIYALSMALGTLLSRVLGLVRDQLFAALFSPTVRDAWTAAFRLPNMFRRILGEGSLSVNFIPVFVETQVLDNTGESAKNLVNSFYTLLLIVLSVLTTFGILFPEFFLNLILDAKFSEIPGKFEMAARMTRIMFGFIFFMSTYAYFMGILNALGRFGLPAMAPVFFNVSMIISNFFPQEHLSMPGDAIAWGVVVGGFLQTAILIPALKKAGYLPKLSRKIFEPKVLMILKNMVPGMLGLGLLQITTIVNMRFASSLGEGPITYIYLADRLLELPLSLVSVSLGTALLPTLSDLWARKDVEKFKQTVHYYFGLNLYIAIPAALGLFMLSAPMVDLLFQRGQFSSADALQTALVVKVYAFILLSSSCVRVLVPSFYAIKNTWVPAAVSGVSLIVHIIIAPILMKEYGLGGLVSSSFLSGLVNLTLLIFFFRRQIGQFQIFSLVRRVLKYSLAAMGLAAVLYFYPPNLFGVNIIAQVLNLTSVILIAAVIYFMISHFLKLEEYQQSSQLIIGKLKRKFLKK